MFMLKVLDLSVQERIALSRPRDEGDDEIMCSVLLEGEELVEWLVKALVKN